MSWQQYSEPATIPEVAELFAVVGVQPFAEAEADAAAEFRADLEKRGQPIGPLDTLIAATALANKAVLVTHNTRQFSRVGGLEVVDWY